MIGGSRFDLSQDYSEEARPRFDFSGHYRYVFSPRWRLQVSPGLTWTAYSKTAALPFVDQELPSDTTKENFLTLMVPVSAQLQVMFGRRPWLYYLGAGPGAYRVWIEHRRHVLRDPASLRLHRGLYPGFTVEAGVERFLKPLPNTSLEMSLAQHVAFAKRDEQFPSGWNSTLGTLGWRIGGNYYFEPRLKKEKTQLPTAAKGKKK